MSTLSAGPYNNNSVTITPTLVQTNKEKGTEVGPSTVASEKNGANDEAVSSTPVSSTAVSASSDSKDNEVTPMDTTPAEG